MGWPVVFPLCSLPLWGLLRVSQPLPTPQSPTVTQDRNMHWIRGRWGPSATSSAGCSGGTALPLQGPPGIREASPSPATCGQPWNPTALAAVTAFPLPRSALSWWAGAGPGWVVWEGGWELPARGRWLRPEPAAVTVTRPPHQHCPFRLTQSSVLPQGTLCTCSQTWRYLAKLGVQWSRLLCTDPKRLPSPSRTPAASIRSLYHRHHPQYLRHPPTVMALLMSPLQHAG